MGKGTLKPRASKDGAARHRRQKREDDYETHLICRICGEELMSISWSHLKKHGLTVDQYKSRYDESFVMSPYLRAGQSRRMRKHLKVPYIPRETVAEIRNDLLEYVRRRGSRGREISMSEVREHDGTLLNQAGRVFGSWKRAVEACGLCTSSTIRFLDKESVAAAVRQCAIANGSISNAALWRQDPALPGAVQRQFGSIPAAARRLGLKYGPRYLPWSDSMVREKIMERRSKGLSITSRAVQLEDGKLYGAACNHFGSWGAALESCGLDYSRISQRTVRSDEDLAREIRAWVACHGPLNCARMLQTDSKLCSALQRRFGTFREAAQACGVEYAPRKTDWTPKLVQRRIRELKKSGHPLNAGAMRGKLSALLRAGMNLFGSWDKALEGAGINPATVRKQGRHDLIEIARDLRAWVNRHGPLNYTRLRESNSRLCSAVEEWIGTVGAAAKALNLPYESRKTRWSKDLIRQRIRSLHSAGKPINAGAFRAVDSGLVAAGIRHFGSWDGAITEAGIDPSSVRKKVSRNPESLARDLRA